MDDYSFVLLLKAEEESKLVWASTLVEESTRVDACATESEEPVLAHDLKLRLDSKLAAANMLVWEAYKLLRRAIELSKLDWLSTDSWEPARGPVALSERLEPIPVISKIDIADDTRTLVTTLQELPVLAMDLTLAEESSEANANDEHVESNLPICRKDGEDSNSAAPMMLRRYQLPTRTVPTADKPLPILA
jgi:hypothetical protein